METIEIEVRMKGREINWGTRLKPTEEVFLDSHYRELMFRQLSDAIGRKLEKLEPEA